MKRVEIESLTKSFLLFFSSLSLLVGTLFYLYADQRYSALDETILTQMRVCSFDLKCEQFTMDFVTTDQRGLYTLFKDREGVHSLFPIGRSEQYLLKLSFGLEQYEMARDEIRQALTRQFLLVVLVIALFSMLFSLYALQPLRSALKLTEEFVKDILHDFNTPLSSIRLNVGMLRHDVGENKKLERIEQALSTVLALQHNLRSYLDQHVSQHEAFDLSLVIAERIAHIEALFPSITFNASLEPLQVHTSRELLVRVIDNLLSNAAKYNKKEGRVDVELSRQTKSVVIKDTGKGIRDPRKVFKRFYTEQERGIGIGLHIVEKLCRELKIPLKLESELGTGTTVRLDISALTLD